MTNRKHTKKALVLSAVSLLLCIAMLVGTTFAWFTDSVTSGKNKIVAGNLDVEVMYQVTNDEGETSWEPMEADTDLFDVELWEPGVVAYNSFQVANVGTLALKYALTLNVDDSETNSFNGKTLEDVIKVAVVKSEDGELPTYTDRADVTDLEFVSISEFNATGALKAAEGKGATNVTEKDPALESEDVFTVILYWEPTDHDNDYNVNNENYDSEEGTYKTSDGEPLHITFGVTVNATQVDYENDSFGPDYDEDLEISPEGYVLQKDEESGLILASTPKGLIVYDASECTEETVTVPDGVVAIGNHAFAENTTVKNLTLPASVKEIEYRAFYGSAIESINLENVETIGERAFRDCDGLKSITFNNLKEIDNGAFLMCDTITEVTIPATVETIANNAFNACTKLATVTIAEGVKTIGDSAFRDTGITTITIPASVQSIGSFAFRDCKSLTEVKFAHETADSLNITANAFLIASQPQSITIKVKNETVKTAVESMVTNNYITVVVEA